MSLDSALDSVSAGRSVAPTAFQPVNSTGVSQAEDRTPASRVESDSDIVSEAAPDQIEGYDWAEDHFRADKLADGMAALRVEPSGAGYLGE